MGIKPVTFVQWGDTTNCPIQVQLGGAGAYPSYFRVKVGCTVDKSPVYHTASTSRESPILLWRACPRPVGWRWSRSKTMCRKTTHTRRGWPLRAAAHPNTCIQQLRTDWPTTQCNPDIQSCVLIYGHIYYILSLQFIPNNYSLTIQFLMALASLLFSSSAHLFTLHPSNKRKRVLLIIANTIKIIIHVYTAIEKHVEVFEWF